MSNDFDRLVYELDVANAVARAARTDAERAEAASRRQNVFAKAREAVDDIVVEVELPELLRGASAATKEVCDQWPDFWYGPDPLRDEDGWSR